MRQSWEDYEAAAEQGPMAITLKVVAGLLLIGVLLATVGYVLGWFGEAASVAQEEFGPREALRKYEWFKGAAAALDKKRADISIYEAEIAGLSELYGEAPASWPRDARQSYTQRRAELIGVRSSYNSLAAEYNAQMAKFNWRFAEAGQLPKGATEPLPREFKPYEEGASK